MSDAFAPRWRVGKNVPLNVYEGDRPVCQCHTAIDARRIVDAVNKALAKAPDTPASVAKKATAARSFAGRFQALGRTEKP